MAYRSTKPWQLVAEPTFFQAAHLQKFKEPGPGNRSSRSNGPAARPKGPMGPGAVRRPGDPRVAAAARPAEGGKSAAECFGSESGSRQAFGWFQRGSQKENLREIGKKVGGFLRIGRFSIGS